MHYRTLGQTGLTVSTIGFGCGAVGGLLVRGEHDEMVAAVARAMELGVNYFDTAQLYGDGVSESNLGRVLDELGADVLVGTKVRPAGAALDNFGPWIVAAVEESLRRLRRDCVDLIQLHNPVALARQAGQGWAGVADIEPVLRAFETLRDQGKVRFWGINGLGETAALQQVVAAGGMHTIQVCYNLLNPSAGMAVPAGFPFQNYERLIDKAEAQQVGVLAIRVLAGGALSGSANRHPHAAPAVAPIASGATLEEDVARAARFRYLVDQGVVDSLVEAAIRFATGNTKVSTAIIGISTLAHLEAAAAAGDKGALPDEALATLMPVWEQA